MSRRIPLRRLLAGVGAFALATAGLIGTGVANAAPGDEGETTGSLTLHKHWENEGSSDGNPAGEPLAGVQFTVTPVLYGGNVIDLTTVEGWGRAETLFTPGGGAPLPLPAGYTLGTALPAAVTNASGVVTFTSLPLGVYRVTETGSGDNLIAGPAAPFFVSVPQPIDGGFNYNVVAYPKNEPGDFTVEKEIITPEGGFKTIKVGDPLSWEVTVNVPAAELAYESLTIADSLPATLTFASWGAIALDGVAFGSGDYTIDPVTHVVTFTQDGLDKINAITAGEDGAAATITAVINTTVASIPEDGVFENEATATLNGTPQTDEGTTNYGKIRINKSSDDDRVTNLSGAQFELYDAAPVGGNPSGNLVATGTTDATGVIEWTVWVGDDDVLSKDFWLRETAALPGHVLPANPWTGPVTVTAGDAESLVQVVAITNHKPKGPELPLTGSTGSLVFGIVGLGMVAAAGATFAVRRRRVTH